MTYQEFIENIKTNIAMRVESDTVLEIQTIVKNNNTGYDGLIMMRPGLNISPTIYLNPYYHRYLEGVCLEDIYADILTTYYRHLPDTSFDCSFFTDFERVRKYLVYRLVNYSRNANMLADVPHIRFLDLAVTFHCQLQADARQQASTRIHNEHMKAWGKDIGDLLECARVNTPRLLPYRYDNLKTLLTQTAPEYCHLPTEEIPLHILSNLYQNHGATSLLYPGLLKRIATKLDSDLILIPSSIHEFLILPIDSPDDLVHCDEMVRSVNETQVADDEILADHAYYYSLDDGTLSYGETTTDLP